LDKVVKIDHILGGTLFQSCPVIVGVVGFVRVVVGPIFCLDIVSRDGTLAVLVNIGKVKVGRASCASTDNNGSLIEIDGIKFFERQVIHMDLWQRLNGQSSAEGYDEACAYDEPEEALISIHSY
jgi:hypothetical protein